MRLSVFLKICEMLKFDYRLTSEKREALKRLARAITTDSLSQNSVRLLEEVQVKAIELEGDTN